MNLTPAMNVCHLNHYHKGKPLRPSEKSYRFEGQLKFKKKKEFILALSGSMRNFNTSKIIHRL